MHPHRILSRISLILSILNLILAAPIVQGIHEARDDDTVEEEDTASLHSSSDAIASPQHSSLSDGSMSSGFPSPYLSSEQSGSDYFWLLKRPPRPSLNPPASLHDPASPHPPSPELTGIQIPEWLQEFAAEMPSSPHLSESSHGSASPHSSSPGSPGIPLPVWMQGLAPEEIPPSPPAVWQGLIHPLPHPSSSGSSETSHDAHSQLEEFTSSHSSHLHPSSFSSDDPLPWYSDGPMSTPDLISMPSHHSMSEELVPSHHLTSDESPPSPSSPSAPSETPPDNAELLNKVMMKKIGIGAAGVAIAGVTIASIVGSKIKHHKHRDCQDSDPSGYVSASSSPRHFDNPSQKCFDEDHDTCVFFT